jgi:hypothetical protein
VLGPGRYLLGVVEIVLLGGFAWLGGTAARKRWLPRFTGAPAYLATAVIALALLIWAAELLGSFGAWGPLPYLLVLAAVGLGLWKFVPRQEAEGGHPRPTQQVGVRATSLPTSIALLIAAIALVHFAAGVKARLSTGMTGFDSTWYHGPFAAGFFQSGDTWSLHFIAPQFLAWFYPANGEIFHAAGMLAFGRDVLSPLLNLGWFAGCLAACWCVGRPYRVAAWSLALGAIALSVPALADQAGEARNDIVGIFFLLAAVGIALNGDRTVRTSVVVGLAAGLAAGTKLNFLLPAAVLVVGMAVIASPGTRWKTLGASILAALAGGGYWYLRNLAHTGNPLPWVHHLGPIDLPAPRQALGGREAHSVLGYLTDGTVWSDWFLPGLHHALWLLWPLLLLASLAGLLLAVFAPALRRAEMSNTRRRWAEKSHPKRQIGPSAEEVGPNGPSAWPLAVAGLVGLASALAWLVAPTSASGPDGMPRGFESGLRYLAPSLILGLALLPAVLPMRLRVAGTGHPPSGRILKPPSQLARRLSERRMPRAGLVVGVVIAAAALGYPIQRHYLADRYKDPTFSAPGLNAAFAWARDISGARIATTSTRQYPLFGTDLSNRVQYLGSEQSHGGFEAPATCRQYRRLLDEGDYDYVIATRDRLEPGKPLYPPQARWTEGPGARVILKKPPTVVFELKGGSPDPSRCK